jgi:DNA-directed RNA polymerase II subunit RPB11
VLQIHTPSDYTPHDALIDSITALISELSLFKERFKEGLKDKQEVIH